MRPITRAQWEHLYLLLRRDHPDLTSNLVSYDGYIELFHEHPPEQWRDAEGARMFGEGS